ncbi:MAG TPA: hypothetical protein QF626_09770, partial [Prochlorococcaceae cyanobacterium Fu_MAG_50]|nr:hypothetical protein [Prochlorococcaceae cyanobacterium Fu_MAG_50]
MLSFLLLALWELHLQLPLKQRHIAQQSALKLETPSPAAAGEPVGPATCGAFSLSYAFRIMKTLKQLSLATAAA